LAPAGFGLGFAVVLTADDAAVFVAILAGAGAEPLVARFLFAGA